MVDVHELGIIMMIKFNMRNELDKFNKIKSYKNCWSYIDLTTQCDILSRSNRIYYNNSPYASFTSAIKDSIRKISNNI